MFKRKPKLVLMYAILNKVEMEVVRFVTGMDIIYIHKNDVLPDKFNICENNILFVIEDSAYEESLLNAIISRTGLKRKNISITKITANIKAGVSELDGIINDSIRMIYNSKLLKRRLEYVGSYYKNDIITSEDSMTYSNYISSNLTDATNIAINIIDLISIIMHKTFDVYTMDDLEFILDVEGVFSSEQLVAVDTICKLLIDLNDINEYVKTRLAKMKENL